jgi:excinuclease ABC subunit B
MGFTANAPYQPTGDQPKAIRQLVDGVRQGMRYQTLLGATGTGKTAVMSWVFEELQRPALVLAHNKTLVSQLYSEFRELLPDAAVEMFISYYDTYTPEAYVPSKDLYIEKENL